ncbi:zinc C3HC4 type RING finger domain-containing protein [Babesia ovis]|uniref:RING-type E3 ubiquitin transferase n=1 Tax=Babesia ovis TaxID=5869 RepID=A0A9W5WU75_BABOV|nr:zinc C3HC4 type RING finger domain-containing protein [Babesia ovis]
MESSEAQTSPVDGTNPGNSSPKDKRQIYDCNICFEDVVEPVVTRCGHLFCWPCLLTWINKPNDHCPVCHAGITKENVIPLYGRGQENKDPRSQPSEPRPAAERPQPQQNQANRNNTAFGGVVFSMFAFPFSIVLPFHYGSHGSSGFFNFMTAMGNSSNLTPVRDADRKHTVDAITHKDTNTLFTIMANNNASPLQTLFKSYSGGKSTMNANNVGDLVRELGFAPSVRELETFKQKVGATCTADQIQELVDTLEHPEDTRENFLKFFRFYDTNNTGTVSRAIVEKLLTHVGEPLSQEELTAFFKKTCTTGDQIQYEQLITKWVSSKHSNI